MAKFVNQRGLTGMWFWRGRPNGGQPFKTRDIVRFSSSPVRPETMRLNGPQIIALLEHAPALLSTLQHLVLDEDRAWAQFDENSGITRVMKMLDRTPLLRIFTMVCSKEWRGRLDPPVKMSELPSLMRLHTFLCAKRDREARGVKENQLFDRRIRRVEARIQCLLKAAEAARAELDVNIPLDHESTKPSAPFKSFEDLTLEGGIATSMRHMRDCRVRAVHRSQSCGAPVASNKGSPPRVTPTEPLVRRRSLPVAQELRKSRKEYADAAWETDWQTKMQDLAAWAEEWRDPPNPKTSVRAGETELEGLPTWAEEFVQHDTETVERRWSDAPWVIQDVAMQEAAARAAAHAVAAEEQNGAAVLPDDVQTLSTTEEAERAAQWDTVVRLATEAMREPDGQDMLRDQYREERREQTRERLRERVRRERSHREMGAGDRRNVLDDGQWLDWSTRDGERHYVD
ncbi:hypothetical protein B0H19DRAFT_1067003 [Mycena capillaripes]|nr:hypothetical protein B0H19DRAFT_1067003 [Mycena capillaripes]